MPPLFLPRPATMAFFVSAAVLVVAMLASPSWAQKPVLTKAEQTQIFDEAIHILGGNANVLSRWVGEVRFASIGDVEPAAHEAALEIVSAVAAQTNLSLVPLQHGVASSVDYLDAVVKSPPLDLSVCDDTREDQCANFVVVFSDAPTMQKLSAALPLRSLYTKAFERTLDIPCFYSPFVSGQMVIRQAFVYVRKDLPKPMLKTCLAEEIYQSFGLFNDYSGSQYFSFNNVVEPKEITDYDRALLRTVYDDRHRPGSPVFVVVRQLMNELGFKPFDR